MYIITFGVRFSPKIVTKFFAKNAKTVAVDIDKFELTQGLVKADISINCDLKNFFNNSKIKKYKRNINNSNNWLNFCYLQKKNNFINYASLTKNKKR